MLPHILILYVCILVSASQRLHVCEYGSCYPATGDLLIGRERNLTASSTCGLRRPERYCIVSHLEEDTKCFTCDSSRSFATARSRNNHRIESIVSSFRDRRRRWWQARNGDEHVSIQLDLEAEFHFTHLIMTFKTFRPKAMLVERSYDFGRTWKVYRYFANNCEKIYPGVSTGPVKRLTDVICESRYSNVVPATRGEVIFRVLPPNVAITDPYSQEVQDLLKLTNLRINFTKLHTLGDDLLDARPDIQEKYYYAMYDMTVRGSCSCYGHASQCTPLPGQTGRAMVHGKCECQHNTKGVNCEMCKDMYQDLPWQPARGRKSHACAKCKCNNHADKCRFDPALYEASGRVSGGVCLNCRHNTMGPHCDECQPFFYRDSEREMDDPHACRPCDCDPSGSRGGGECAARDDTVLGVRAGACVCRKNVKGQRCDTCIDGFWNMRTENPDGCEACTCDTVGTIGNLGCDKVNGLCRCKRYVAGRNCDRCYPTFWGLSADIPDGCKPCSCDVGGSLTGECDSTTGQCECRPNINGRACEAPKMGYYFPNLDYNVYEAEYAKGIGNTLIQVREPLPNHPPTWSGPGFMKVSEGDSIEFKIDGIKLSMYYDVIIRYEPLMPERWDDVRVSVVRPGTVDIHGACANIIPQDDLKPTSLQPGNRYVVLTPRTCLEKGGEYTVRVDFTKYKSDRRTPEASVLVDSIALTPNVDSIPIFQGSGEPERMKQEYLYYRCRRYQFGLIRGEVPDVCKRYIFSISAVIHSKALECNCDQTGSVTNECNTLGGQCQCKNNVIGRQCDRCAPGTFGFGPQGCIPCNCDPVGARDNNCNSESGQCLCIPNAYGRTCGECQAGFWRFPHCRPCDCNGNADVCDNKSGDCRECRDHTAGNKCERCAVGYYGDPRLSVRIPCHECQCPGAVGSGYHHADGCSLVPRTKDMVCQCKPGYTGNTCDKCIDNYFGNPVVAGGTCQPCVCNNNIDSNTPGSCNSQTGECLLCLFQTKGFNCEHCMDGFYGDATQQGCQECICNTLGTDSRVSFCDRITGQCPCLPNVVGQYCDQCAVDHWNLASERGCENCSCDAAGSLATRCNEFTGQCQCQPDRGGRDCSQCKDLYWGDPQVHCTACDCNQLGSESYQCNRKTGQCPCRPGITGLKCDRCDRGTTGELPNCVPCGECFNTWDREINDIRVETSRMLWNVNNTKKEGGVDVFEKEFQQIENILKEVKGIIANASYVMNNVEPLQTALDQINANLTENEKIIKDIARQVSNTSQRVVAGYARLDTLNTDMVQLKERAQTLRNDATQVLIDDVEGAYNVTEMAKRKSDAAKAKVDRTSAVIQRSNQVRQEVDDLINTETAQFNTDMGEVEKEMSSIDGRVADLSGKIVEINSVVCDGNGNPCDDQCGGGGCDKCGGLSCSKGAVTKSENALQVAKDAEMLLADKVKKVAALLVQARDTKQRSVMANDEAQKAQQSALKAKSGAESVKMRLNELLRGMQDFLADEAATAESIQKVADEVLAMKISYTPRQIEDLASRITETIRKLQNVGVILSETKDNVTRAQLLKQRADNASSDARQSLGVADELLGALEGASQAQGKAEMAITEAEKSIAAAQNDLNQIEEDTKVTLNKSRDSDRMVAELEGKLAKLTQRFTENRISINKARQEADVAIDLADKAEQDAIDLETKYARMIGPLIDKHNKTATVKERAERLRRHAEDLSKKTAGKLSQLKDLLKKSESTEKQVNDVQAEVDALTEQMKTYLAKIQEKSQYYTTCVAQN